MDTWTLDDNITPEHLGFIPYWIDTQAEESFVDQIEANYAHGGGWHDFDGFIRMNDGTLTYPEDPPLKPIAMVSNEREIMTLHHHSWVCVYNRADKTFRVARID